MRVGSAVLSLLVCLTAHAQWELQQSQTTADLRGIHSLPNGVAWASGTDGTVLHTEDSGQTWLPCSIPPGAEHLDFRGIQAFDRNTAIVMSSGKGDLSRLYKTIDACKTWKLVLTNPDAEGFWDAIQFDLRECGFGVVVGDPVAGHFPFFLTYDFGTKWEKQIRESPLAEKAGEGLFAASNSSLAVTGLNRRSFVTGGKGGPRLLWFWAGGDDTNLVDPLNVAKGTKPFRFITRGWGIEPIPVIDRKESSGAFSLAATERGVQVIVGGDFSAPDQRASTAWYRGRYMRWTPAAIPPHGYRSSVAYNPTHKAWITVGPNGTDLSTDDGRNWRALKPDPSGTPDEDKNWNALSLPFVVGPHGRIGLLRPEALNKP